MVNISKRECDATLLPKLSPPRLVQPTSDEDGKKAFWGSAEKTEGISHFYKPSGKFTPIYEDVLTPS